MDAYLNLALDYSTGRIFGVPFDGHYIRLVIVNKIEERAMWYRVLFLLSIAEIVIGSCVREQGETMLCDGLNPDDISESMEGISRLRIAHCRQPLLDFTRFGNVSQLRHFQLVDCHLEAVTTSVTLPILSLDLSRNRLIDSDGICRLLSKLPNLRFFSLADNLFRSFNICDAAGSVLSLNLSNNRLESFDWTTAPSTLQSLDLSNNRLDQVPKGASTLKNLDLSNNLIRDAHVSSLPMLDQLLINENPMEQLRLQQDLPRLKTLEARKNQLRVLHFDMIEAPAIERINLEDSFLLSAVLGTLPPSVRHFSLTGSNLDRLPVRFFSRSPRDLFVDLSNNVWRCDECLSRWIRPINWFIPHCNTTIVKSTDCSFGIAHRSEPIRGRIDTDIVLHCGAYGEPMPSLRWFLVRPETLIGEWNPKGEKISMNWTRNGAYSMLKGGALLVRKLRRELVERYRCEISEINGLGRNESTVLRLRLDFSAWYSLAVFDSVFVGSCVCALLVCFGSFIVNILWMIFRKTILWWIKRAERMSRVRKMVEAMEKYRARQMEHLHERYQTRMEHVRESYRQQVEQLRHSYASQAERFRGYRAAQLESVTQHLDSIRDNYNQQLSRMREYGARRAENLWESYERQVNRMKTFSLQQRLRLMRQHKVKQRYLNKLLDTLNNDPTGDPISKQLSEMAVLAALGESVEPRTPSRNSSFYSLPDYALGEETVHLPASSTSHEKSPTEKLHETNL